MNWNMTLYQSEVLFWNRAVFGWCVLSLFCVKKVNIDNDNDSQQVENFLPRAVTTWPTRDHLATLILLHIHSSCDVICLGYILLEIRYTEWRKWTCQAFFFVVKHRKSNDVCTTLYIISLQRVKLWWQWKTMRLANIWQIACTFFCLIQ